MVEQKPSKLMTRVRFPSPAPTFSMTCIVVVPSFRQACCCSFRQIVRFCSHCAPLFSALGNLSHRPLDILGKHLRRLVPTLRPDLRIGQLGAACLREAAVTERGEGEFIAQS